VLYQQAHALVHEGVGELQEPDMLAVGGLAKVDHQLVGPEHSRKELSLGPRVDEYFLTCLDQDNKWPFLRWLAIGTGAAMTTLGLSWQHLQRLLAAPRCLLRTHYIFMVFFPTAWALSALLTLLCPRSLLLSELIRGQSEALALFLFMRILFLIISAEILVDDRQNHTEAIAGAIIEALNKDGEKPHFAVPPFGCCLGRCLPSHRLTARILLQVTLLVKQFVFVQLFVSVFGMWAVLTFPPEMVERTKLISAVVEKASSLLAVYGLFILYKATHDLLHNWRTTRKFVSIKFVILLTALQSFFTGPLIRLMRKPSNKCLMDPTEPGSWEFVIDHYTAVLLAVETVIMILLNRSAFPVEEVQAATKMRHVDLIEIDLAQHQEQEEKLLDR